MVLTMTNALGIFPLTATDREICRLTIPVHTVENQEIAACIEGFREFPTITQIWNSAHTTEVKHSVPTREGFLAWREPPGGTQQEPAKISRLSTIIDKIHLLRTLF